VDVEREWLDLVASLLSTPLTTLPEARIASTLMATFDAPACAFHCRPGPDTVIQRMYPEGLFSADRQAEWIRLSIEQPSLHPLLSYYLGTGDMSPQQVADVPSVFAGPRARGQWVELGRCHGFEHQLAVPLAAGAHGRRWFVLGRPELFSPARMALAGRVQRLIVGLDRQATTLQRWQRGMRPAAGAVATDVHLTPRELAVLTLVAEGLTAAAAARRLVVAERTVHKHLERVYAKFGVSDRVSAVLHAQRLGVLPETVLAAAR